MNSSDILKRLIELSHELGREDRQLAILGEGNVSADLGDGTFYVKASGSQLATIDAVGFTRVEMAPIFEALERPELTDEEVRKVLESCQTRLHGCLRWKPFCTRFASRKAVPNGWATHIQFRCCVFSAVSLGHHPSSATSFPMKSWSADGILPSCRMSTPAFDLP